MEKWKWLFIGCCAFAGIIRADLPLVWKVGETIDLREPGVDLHGKLMVAQRELLQQIAAVTDNPLNRTFLRTPESRFFIVAPNFFQPSRIVHNRPGELKVTAPNESIPTLSLIEARFDEHHRPVLVLYFLEQNQENDRYHVFAAHVLPGTVNVEAAAMCGAELPTGPVATLHN